MSANLKEIVDHLSHFSKRPGMYVRPLDVAHVESYLQGLRNGCAFGGLEVSRELYQQVTEARGWKWRATGILWHMWSKKLSEEAIIQELVAIEMDAYREATKTLNELMSQRAENQGVRMVGDFTSKAIPVASKPKRAPKGQQGEIKKSKRRKRKDR